MTGSEVPPSFRLAYVPGVTPAKWVRTWNERFPDVPLTLHSVTAAEAPDVLRDGGADAGFVRLPVDRTVLSAIPLYTETTVVVVPKDHVVSAVDEVTAEDLADEVVFHPLDDVLDWERPPGQPAFERPATTADAVELVAAGVGLLVVPQSLARLHHRKDLTYRPLVDAPQSSVALSWPEDATTDLVEDFIGVVRGRTVNSTRGRTTSQSPAATEQPKRKRPEAAGASRRQSGAGGRSARSGSGSGGAKGAKGAKSPRRGKPRRRS
ncbi:LysR substrate-binding domain-containing protein [Streptomyces sp. R11]|uniref:LysR substrate-binding domain-containing protein n=1 Tax=Streptomyces sp. R11 TaxID=3238625 RepID=A0AB39MVC6_9ACTN